MSASEQRKQTSFTLDAKSHQGPMVMPLRRTIDIGSWHRHSQLVSFKAHRRSITHRCWTSVVHARRYSQYGHPWTRVASYSRHHQTCLSVESKTTFERIHSRSYHRDSPPFKDKDRDIHQWIYSTRHSTQDSGSTPRLSNKVFATADGSPNSISHFMQNPPAPQLGPPAACPGRSHRTSHSLYA